MNVSKGDVPVDLRQLRNLTDGDSDLERKLLGLFVEQSQLCITSLKQHIHQGEEEEWKMQSHKFKGSAANIGALQLKKLCEHAEHNYTLSQDMKNTLLLAIEDEFEAVKTYLEEQLFPD